MIRTIVVVTVVLGFVSVSHAQLDTYFEDHFEGEALDSMWNTWGTGSYGLVDGDLEFVTETGALVDVYEASAGVPHHMYLIDPPDYYTEWSAVARMRFNTPDETYEQVSLISFQDTDSYVKWCYQQGGPGLERVLLTDFGGSHSQQATVVPAYTDYFWLRLDRDGTTYTAYASSDLTDDPNAVSWTQTGVLSNPIANPQVGVAGWNTLPDRSGELAEFDYFRLQGIPEPATIGLFALAGLGLCRRR